MKPFSMRSLILLILLSFLAPVFSFANCSDSLLSTLIGKEFVLVAEDAKFDFKIVKNEHEVIVVESKGLFTADGKPMVVKSMIVTREEAVPAGIQESVYLRDSNYLYLQFFLRRDPWNTVRVFFWVPVGAAEDTEIKVIQRFNTDGIGSADNKFSMYLRWKN